MGRYAHDPSRREAEGEKKDEPIDPTTVMGIIRQP
jgi:hypothetical protein